MKKSPPAQRRSVKRAPPKRVSGLAHIDTDAVRKAVEEQHALAIIRRLQSELLRVDGEKKSFTQPKRSDAIRLLGVLRDVVSELTDEFDPKSEIRFASHATTLLDSLLGQLSDLDYGRVGDLLRPTEGVAGAAYKFEEKRIREMALVVVSCLRGRGMLLSDACREASAELTRKGLRFRNAEITDTLIRSWWKNSPK